MRVTSRSTQITPLPDDRAVAGSFRVGHRPVGDLRRGWSCTAPSRPGDRGRGTATRQMRVPHPASPR